ncbi:MAG: hypothetical protein OXU70_11120 [Gammaproteobacteria bacterium]|nr:hypothetical protein [Gammaproteobacteria bacterium]
MYLQYCVKGIAGATASLPGITKAEAIDAMSGGRGIFSNWWWAKKKITPEEEAAVLTDANLYRHLHDYATFGNQTPFISLACGAVERDTVIQYNWIYSAKNTALMFATDNWTRPGALFFLWVPTSHRAAVAVRAVAEPVGDLNIYRRWSPYQLEGEVTAKVHIPANQIERLEWWVPKQGRGELDYEEENPNYVKPEVLSNVRGLF